MRVRLTLRNYRCFAQRPAVFELGHGFTAFIGPNNAGKSTLIKFLFEARAALALLKRIVEPPTCQQMLRGTDLGHVNLPSPITDPNELVYDKGVGPLEFEVTVEPRIKDDRNQFVKTALWRFHPERSSFSIELTSSAGERISQVAADGSNFVSNAAQIYSGDVVFSFGDLLEVVDWLINTQYLGPFRNAINEGGGTYFDLQLGTGFLQQWHSWKTGGNKSQNRAVGRGNGGRSAINGR